MGVRFAARHISKICVAYSYFTEFVALRIATIIIICTIRSLDWFRSMMIMNALFSEHAFITECVIAGGTSIIDCHIKTLFDSCFLYGLHQLIYSQVCGDMSSRSKGVEPHLFYWHLLITKRLTTDCISAG